MKKLGALSKPLTLAIDWHDEMYYGDSEVEGVVGTQPKRGSHHAYRFATASVLLDGERFTLAVAPIFNASLLEHVRELINHILNIGVKIKMVLFDRGYFSAELINYLNSLGADYIIQLPASIRRLGEGEDFMYTTRGHKRVKSEQVTFRLVTVRAKDSARAMLYNLWVQLNYKYKREIPADTLKLQITLSLVLSFLPDIEAYNEQNKQDTF